MRPVTHIPVPLQVVSQCRAAHYSPKGKATTGSRGF